MTVTAGASAVIAPVTPTTHTDMKNESELTRETVKAFNRLEDCYAFRVHGGPNQKKGTLDITGCYKGYFFSIEQKMPDKRNNVTDIQAANIRKIDAAGGIVGVATSIEESIELLRFGYQRKLSARRNKQKTS